MWRRAEEGCGWMINQACVGVGRCVSRYVKVDMGGRGRGVGEGCGPRHETRDRERVIRNPISAQFLPSCSSGFVIARNAASVNISRD